MSCASAIYHSDNDGVTQTAQSLLDDVEAALAEQQPSRIKRSQVSMAAPANADLLDHQATMPTIRPIDQYAATPPMT